MPAHRPVKHADGQLLRQLRIKDQKSQKQRHRDREEKSDIDQRMNTSGIFCKHSLPDRKKADRENKQDELEKECHIEDQHARCRHADPFFPEVINLNDRPASLHRRDIAEKITVKGHEHAAPQRFLQVKRAAHHIDDHALHQQKAQHTEDSQDQIPRIGGFDPGDQFRCTLILQHTDQCENNDERNEQKAELRALFHLYLFLHTMMSRNKYLPDHWRTQHRDRLQ